MKEKEPANSWEKKTNWDHKYRHENMSVDVDVWYPMLKSITFESYFIHLTHRETLAIINFFLRKVNPNKFKEFSWEDVNIINQLEKKIDSYFEKYPALKDGAIFRMTGRSGKDAEIYYPDRMLNKYKENLKKYTNKPFDQIEDLNLKYTCIPLYENLFVKSGKEVLNILLTSERLNLDLKDWLRHGGREQIVLRKWEPNLKPEYEFRGFVKDFKLRGICQYDRIGVYQEIIDKREELEKMINKFFYEKVAPLMKIPDYSIDFGYINGEIKLIEFSPLLRCTSARLFRWDLHSKEMIEGDGKLMVKTQKNELDYMFVKDWEKSYLDEFKPYHEQYNIEPTSYYEDALYYMSYLNPFNIYNYFFPKKKNTKLIFVVSVLKDNFYWSKKYIRYDNNENKLIGKGELNNHCIIIDKNGFGWIKEKKNSKCYGEIIEILDEDLEDIEYFYGMDDGKCKEIEVKLKENGKIMKVYANIIKELPKKIEDKENKEVEEYTKEIEDKYFNPMQHIIHQQEIYLNMSLDFDINDKW